MDKKARAELGEILTDQETLLNILAKNPSALEGFPNLQRHLTNQNQKSVDYRRALRNKDFTKEEYRDEILDRLAWFGYQTCIELDMEFLVEAVAARVGDDIDKIKDLTIKEAGVEQLSRLWHLMGESFHAGAESRPPFPWEATKGQTNYDFWKKAHLAYDAMMNDGYNSHYKLNLWSQEHLDTSCPQSFPKFARMHGDPRLINSWVKWSGWVEE